MGFLLVDTTESVEIIASEDGVVPGSPEYMAMAGGSGRHPHVFAILRYFSWSHLPVHLQPVSRTMAETALKMCGMVPDSAELVTGLRKLLEAKDAFVRAALD